MSHTARAWLTSTTAARRGGALRLGLAHGSGEWSHATTVWPRRAGADRHVETHATGGRPARCPRLGGCASQNPSRATVRLGRGQCQRGPRALAPPPPWGRAPAGEQKPGGPPPPPAWLAARPYAASNIHAPVARRLPVSRRCSAPAAHQASHPRGLPLPAFGRRVEAAHALDLDACAPERRIATPEICAAAALQLGKRAHAVPRADRRRHALQPCLELDASHPSPRWLHPTDRRAADVAHKRC